MIDCIIYDSKEQAEDEAACSFFMCDRVSTA